MSEIKSGQELGNDIDPTTGNFIEPPQSQGDSTEDGVMSNVDPDNLTDEQREFLGKDLETGNKAAIEARIQTIRAAEMDIHEIDIARRVKSGEKAEDIVPERVNTFKGLSEMYTDAQLDELTEKAQSRIDLAKKEIEILDRNGEGIRDWTSPLPPSPR